MMVLNGKRDRGERCLRNDREGGFAVPHGGRRHCGENVGSWGRGSHRVTVDLHALPEEPNGDHDDKPPSSQPIVVEDILHFSEPGGGEAPEHRLLKVGEGVARSPGDGYQCTSLLLMAHPLCEIGGQQPLHGRDTLQVLPLEELVLAVQAGVAVKLVVNSTKVSPNLFPKRPAPNGTRWLGRRPADWLWQWALS